MTVLLDANVLIALIVADHVHYQAAGRWLAAFQGSFATCPITQGSLLRFLLREGLPTQAALATLKLMTAHPRHHFWPEDVPYADVRLAGVLGHRQITDAYLAELARRHRGRLATFDEGLAALHAGVSELVPTMRPQPPLSSN